MGKELLELFSKIKDGRMGSYGHLFLEIISSLRGRPQLTWAGSKYNSAWSAGLGPEVPRILQTWIRLAPATNVQLCG